LDIELPIILLNIYSRKRKADIKTEKLKASPYYGSFYNRLYHANDTDGNLLLKTKYFIGGNYEIEVDAEGHQRKLHYLSASTGLFAIFVQENTGENMYYIHKDYPPAGGQVLGSFQSITDEDGTLVEKYAFDPWGRQRNPVDCSFRVCSEKCVRILIRVC
jgi:hypothetical protein